MQNVKDLLDTVGYAVIPNVLTKKEAINMQIGMWETLECLTQPWDTPVHRDNPVSWVEMLNYTPNIPCCIKIMELDTPLLYGMYAKILHVLMYFLNCGSVHPKI